ncbi:transporter substrate-binding domain-containing protein [Micrococcoides hystricis]|uniref:Transporter substrate-binding domain-containing protein n=1 Tax=Micrococcoides hystricis TaxID=1572761 RepID=A0ABV6P7N4_9MICC
MTIRKKLAAVLAASALALGATACGDGGGDGEGDASKVEGQTFTVVTDTSYVPFEFQEDGKTVGFDIDLINAIAEEAGFEIDLKNSNFDGIIPGLQTNSYDMAIAGIGITEERKKSIDYSDPYYRAGLIVAVTEDNDEIKGIDDLAGKNVATRLGSTSAKYLADNVPEAEAQPYEQLDQAYLAVENGRADAILYDEPNVAYYIKTTGDGLKMVGEADDTVDFGIAFPKGSDDLRTAVNEALATLKDNGKYNELHKEWFGTDAKDN